MAKIYAILKMLKSTGMEKMLAIKIYLKLLYNFEKEDNLNSFLIMKQPGIIHQSKYIILTTMITSANI